MMPIMEITEYDTAECADNLIIHLDWNPIRQHVGPFNIMRGGDMLLTGFHDFVHAGIFDDFIYRSAYCIFLLDSKELAVLLIHIENPGILIHHDKPLKRILQYLIQYIFRQIGYGAIHCDTPSCQLIYFCHTMRKDIFQNQTEDLTSDKISYIHTIKSE